MNINATIIIQVFDFGLAYVLLRYFLFKPAINVIRREESEQEKIKSIIAQQEQSIVLKEKERQKNWYQCRSYFMQHRPSIDVLQLFIFKRLIPEVEQYHIEDDAVAILLIDVQRALEKKINHVS